MRTLSAKHTIAKERSSPRDSRVPRVSGPERRRAVPLGPAEVRVHGLAPFTDADDEDAARERIERAAVADLELAVAAIA